VLALPAPQAAKLAEGVAPQMASSLSAAPLEGCWCAMLAFASRAPLPFDGLFVNGAAAPLSWVARDSSKPRRPQVADCWVLHSSRAFFKEHSELDPVAAADRLAADFRALAAGLDVQLPQLVFATAHRWRFAFAPENAIRGAVWDADLALAACGDWARGGRVEGAFLAGVEAAKRVLEALKQPPAQ
jgi:predicted NAD/FAD-dependent oxidoreductase